MATKTANLKLTKPEYNETADIEIINANMDTIDTVVKGVQDGVVEHTMALAEIRNELANIPTLDSIYPVGSIYMSLNPTNPSQLFGGTWEQIKDRFLLAAGTTYSAGGTGGEAAHKLTAAESGVPAHAHGLNNHTHKIDSHGHGFNQPRVTGGGGATISGGEHTNTTRMSNTGGGRTDWGLIEEGAHGGNVLLNVSAGIDSPTIGRTLESGSHSHRMPAHEHSVYGGSVDGSGVLTTRGSSDSTTNNAAKDAQNAHNNMPPYLTVYMWKRTA